MDIGKVDFRPQTALIFHFLVQRRTGHQNYYRRQTRGRPAGALSARRVRVISSNASQILPV
jgi:hypothetical protein